MSLHHLPPMRRKVRRQLARMIPQGVVYNGVTLPHKYTTTSVMRRWLDRLWPTVEAVLTGRHRVCRWAVWAVVGLLVVVAVRMCVGVGW